jgi:hypothetical protein
MFKRSDDEAGYASPACINCLERNIGRGKCNMNTTSDASYSDCLNNSLPYGRMMVRADCDFVCRFVRLPAELH